MSTLPTHDQDADDQPGDSGERPSRPARQPIGTRTLVGAALVGLCVAAMFSFIALRELGDTSVDPVDALEDLAVVPAVPEGTPTAVVGEPAPSVRLDYLDGGRQELGELRGTPVLLNFWSSTCAPCVEEMPLFQAVSERAGDRLQVVGIDVIDTAEGAAEQLRRTGVTYRNADDPRGELFATFAGTALPRTVLLGADGTVLEMVGGALDESGLDDLLRRNGVDAG
ncbi:MAG: TlpA family protein disulfide reductase [Acidobacteria bacterium]|nr:TlpA family protein disulfide reductase [Acidobacteriota bacterium]